MNGGIVNCDCGQQQYVETANETVECIKCKEIHQVYPILEPEPEPETEIGEDNGTDI